MSKIQIQEGVSIEVIGTTVHLSMPASYSLNIDSIYKPTSPVREIKQSYTYNANTSSLANQIDQVEKDTRPFGDK